MRKLSFLVLSFIIILTGCGGEASDSLEFYSDKGGDSWETVSNDLSAAGYPGFEMYSYSDVASYQSVIQQSLPTEDAPGLFTWWSGENMKDLVEGGYLTDLTDEWENYYVPAGVNPNLADSMTFDGKIYGAPFNILYSGVYYNTEVFEEYNLEVPTTFEEFESICDTLLENGITPIGLKDDPWASFLWFQTLIASYDPQLYTDLVNGDVKYTDDKIYEVMHIYQDWINKGYFADPVDPTTQVDDFSKGKTAMIYEVDNTSIALGRDFGLEAGTDYDMFVFPSMDENTPDAIFYEVAPILVSANSAQNENAIQALRGYYDADIQQTLLDNDGFHATENTKLPNEVMTNMQDYAAADSGNVLLLRYYESEPTSVVSTATDAIWKFHYNPTDEQLDESLQLIQSEVEKEE